MVVAWMSMNVISLCRKLQIDATAHVVSERAVGMWREMLLKSRQRANRGPNYYGRPFLSSISKVFQLWSSLNTVTKSGWCWMDV